VESLKTSAKSKKVNRGSLELKELRLKLGWSLSQMCRRLGIDKSLVAKYEAGKKKPDRETLIQYEALFSVLEEQSRKNQIRPLADSLLQAESLQQVSEDVLDH
jgi:transcriptional regulator with XRE-family HTH domain